MPPHPRKSNALLPLFAVAVSLLCMAGCGSGPTEDWMATVPDQPDFTFDVKPILSDRCFACHGPDPTKQKAGLALHTAEGAFRELREKPGHFAIVPGDPAASEVYRRLVSERPDVVMPPPESHLTTTPYEREVIRRWIEQGAIYQPHWAFTPPRPVAVPEVDDPAAWAESAIDTFVLAMLTKKGMQPSPAADKATLLRRVTFDLTGLPPTPEELAAFVEDDAPVAYEKVVDRLLASPHYGERMASIWLDLSRYADSHGYQDDRPRTMWPWRDWVVSAYNDNLNYRDFVTWQLAGDLLPDPTYAQRLATGFNRNHPITQEGGIIPEEYLAEYASDRTHVFGTAFLGLTVECAKCHTHKYDPILHTDYYQLTAFFNNINERGAANGYYDEAPVPNMTIEDPALIERIEGVKAYIARLESTQRELERSRGLPIVHAPEASAAERLDRGLVAHYRFDENPGKRTRATVPEGENGWMNYNLPPTFANVEVTTGNSGDALTFDGENYVSLGLIGDFEHHQPFSATVWIRHDGRGNTRAIFGKRMDELRHNGYDLVLTTGNKLAFRLSGFWWQPDRYPDDLEAVEVRSVASVPAGAWQSAAVTYDGSGRADGIQLYLGGRAQEQRTLVDNLRGKTILNGNHFALGNWNQRGKIKGELGGFAGGAIDELRVYDRELSPVEIALLSRAVTPEDLPEASLALDRFAPASAHKHMLLHYSDTYRRNVELLDSLRAVDQSVPSVMIMEERDTVAPTYLRLRGEYDQLGERVERKAPSALPPLPEGAPKDRLGLAQWLFSDDHPLTARVAVNRLWQQIFGRGLVKTADDFGNQGELPTHPELLDYLALAYRDSGWDTKAMLRTMVLSKTYRQDGRLRPGDHERDGENKWLARGPAGKLTAEMLRDQALAASGLLNDEIGGKWVKPYQPKGLWNEMASEIGEPVYRPSRGADLFRRSLYTYFKRTIPPPDMLTMDAAERTVCTVKRQETSTPLQALLVLNAPLYHEASHHLARTLLARNLSGTALIERAFERIVSRPPNPEERDILIEMLEENRTHYSSEPTAEPTAASLVVSAIFNLDEAQRK
ncbi:DUF1553 domain-containing protein [Lewinella sp. JB7]|uniref:DUF1553 domain-containing protein n=1 Tax=Lewinella sp. JB7 TaxID=2962887 RepID=UPI0020C93B20|nr:DUF1553 domain-containing protein [Lewinella sp. JB7]MCP9236557.1 DUF1553 domain-containing protein [Lewinella sp. JB7]